MIDMGLIHMVNILVKTIRAKIKLAVTHQINMMILFSILAFMKLSGALKSSLCLGSSHFNLTNHHSGIRLMVYSVHDLSV